MAEAVAMFARGKTPMWQIIWNDEPDGNVDHAPAMSKRARR
jgi:hypothetical protein